MKFSKTGRQNVDTNKFIENKPKGSFLERFKGRTTTMDKEGHLGVVKSTNMPIKAVLNQPMQAYSNQKSQKMDVHRIQNTQPQLLRKSSQENFTTQNDRYDSFARNFKKTENVLAKSHNSPSFRRSMSKIGNDIMRQDNNSSAQDSFNKRSMSHSLVPKGAMRNSGSGFSKSFKVPDPKNVNHNPYSSSKIPLAMSAGLNQQNGDNETSVYKSSFYSEQNSPKPSNPYKNIDMPRKAISKPYSQKNFSGGNSDGFINTAVSTPLHYKKRANHGSHSQNTLSANQQQCNDALTILRRSMDKNR